MYLRHIFLLLLIFSTAISQAQSITGLVSDANDDSEVISANVKLMLEQDTTVWQGTVTDLEGKFSFSSVKPGEYRLLITYIGYIPLTKVVEVSSGPINLGKIEFQRNVTALKDVVVAETQVRVQQKEDTSEFNANAYKTAPNSSAEDMIKKMPGVTIENGKVQAQGEDVKKVTVDGKEFFGEDATLALRNLPSEIIDRVQVFDRMSDQAAFTGFDDGRGQKSMNIVTKNGMNNSVFGRIYAGYGYTDDHNYAAGANINWFDKNRRVTFIGISNNINQQNFSSQDLVGVSAGTSNRGGGGGGGRGGPGGGGWNQNSAASNFLVGQQGGITTTHSVGLNYIDVWGKLKKVKAAANYFFNYGSNNNLSTTARTFFSETDTSLRYNEMNNATSSNLNHRVNLRLEYTIDSANSLIITPKASFQTNQRTTSLDGLSAYNDLLPINLTATDNFAKNMAYNIGGDVLYQHKFKKLGRTFSINVNNTWNSRMGNSTLVSENIFGTASDTILLDQQGETKSTGYSLDGNVSYTEPLSKFSQLQLNYTPSYTINTSNQETFNLVDSTGDYSNQDLALSSQFENQYMTQRTGLTFRYQKDKLNFSVGANYQYAELLGKQIFPTSFSINKSFHNVLPTAMFNYKFTDRGNIRIYYRTSTAAPSVNQLQNVVNNSNTLSLSSGNADLKQSYTHFAMVRYGISDPKTSRAFFIFNSIRYVQNYIGTSTLIAQQDTTILGDVFLGRGAQFSQPVNLNGQLNLSSFITLALPLKKIKSNLNLNFGFTYLSTPGQINFARNNANTFNVNAGFVLSSNISEKLDFSIGYKANYNVVKNTLQANANNNYFNHQADVNLNWVIWKGLFVTSTLQNTLFAGIAQGFNQNIFIWNAGLGYRFLKDKSLELRASVNDILNQNNGISRNVTETYVEDVQTQVLKRYWLVTLTYNLKFYKK
jgi:hypothetical protein